MGTEVEIVIPENLKDKISPEFVEAEIQELESIHKRLVKRIEFQKVDEEAVKEIVDWLPVGFQRIRRITGYLVGDLSRFNDAKRAEVEDRVKHDTCECTEGR